MVIAAFHFENIVFFTTNLETVPVSYLPYTKLPSASAVHLQGEAMEGSLLLYSNSQPLAAHPPPQLLSPIL